MAPNNITVAATDPTGTALTRWSNYGPAVDIAAPGEDVYTTDNDGSYTPVQGTSFAAALVSGASALLLSIEPRLSPEEVKEIIKGSSDRLGDGFGIGLLNIRKAVQEVLDRKRQKDRERLLLACLVGAGVVVAVAGFLLSH